MGGLEYWSNGVLKDWSVGVLECWSVGVLEFWSSRVSYKHMLQVVGFELRVKKLNTQHSMRTKHQRPTLQYPINPSLHHSNTPLLHHASTPILQCQYSDTHLSITPVLHHSNTPILFSGGAFMAAL
jgi:hypothetical protein